MYSYNAWLMSLEIVKFSDQAVLFITENGHCFQQDMEKAAWQCF
jgi:hypothetical protein